MKRPLSNNRPIGPFLQRGSSVSEFDKVEVQRNDETEDTNYTVAGVHGVGMSESVGIVVDTNAVVINGDHSFALFHTPNTGPDFEGDEGAEITAPEGGKVGIKEASENLVNIIIDE